MDAKFKSMYLMLLAVAAEIVVVRSVSRFSVTLEVLDAKLRRVNGVRRIGVAPAEEASWANLMRFALYCSRVTPDVSF